jgi:TATA-binding protein-associated factor
VKNSVEHDLDLPTTMEVEKENKPKKQATHIFQALQYLRKLCNHPLLVVNDKHPSYNRVNDTLKKTNRSLHDISNAPKLLALK